MIVIEDPHAADLRKSCDVSHSSHLFVCLSFLRVPQLFACRLSAGSKSRVRRDLPILTSQRSTTCGQINAVDLVTLVLAASLLAAHSSEETAPPSTFAVLRTRAAYRSECKKRIVGRKRDTGCALNQKLIATVSAGVCTSCHQPARKPEGVRRIFEIGLRIAYMK
eukprot:3583298-Pleurochrysis_carterae.AAC.2